jgi:hypothetical protein
LPPEAIAINIRCDSATSSLTGLPPRRILFNLTIGRKSVFPEGSSRVEHDLDHLWFVETATDFGAELLAHGGHKPALDLGAGRERRHYSTPHYGSEGNPEEKQQLAVVLPGNSLVVLSEIARKGVQSAHQNLILTAIGC